MNPERSEREDKMDELLNLLSEIRPDVDFQNEEALIDDEILDSFDIISIVGEINDQFDIDINVNDLLPENFNTVEAMWDLIQKLQNE